CPAILELMGRRSRCVCALIACTAFLAAAALAPRTASADDSNYPTDSAQTSSSSASSTARNDTSTTQVGTQTQSAGSGQSQSTVQVAPRQQAADASAHSTQHATNVAGGATAIQRNTSSSSSVATNANKTN